MKGDIAFDLSRGTIGQDGIGGVVEGHTVLKNI